MVAIVSKISGSIECQCSVRLCIDSTTIKCNVVSEVVDSTEAKYSIVNCIDSSTIIVCWVVDEIADSIEAKYCSMSYCIDSSTTTPVCRAIDIVGGSIEVNCIMCVDCTTTTNCWVIDEVVGSTEANCIVCVDCTTTTNAELLMKLLVPLKMSTVLFCQLVDKEHLAERMSKTRRLFNCAMMSAYNTFYTLYCELHTRPCMYIHYTFNTGKGHRMHTAKTATLK